jgi:reverse transcriptase-like protein
VTTILLRLKNVVYAPQLKANLLSADRLNKENMGISLLPINGEIIDLQNKKRLGAICRLNNIYIVNTGHMRNGGQHSYFVEEKPKSIRLWVIWDSNIRKLENLVRGMKPEKLTMTKTWELIPIENVPAEHNILSGKWIFRLKSDGRNRYLGKSRWVVRGFQQKYGIDCHETFATVARNSSYRLVLAQPYSDSMSLSLTLKQHSCMAI